MKELTEGVVLYHGSYCEVLSPDLGKCAKYKDFGQGFYLTSSLEQAKNFSKLATRKAIANGIADVSQAFGVVSSYQFFLKPEKQLAVHQLKEYDVIGGKIADDSTNATITAYMAGTFGEIGTDSADHMCISLLLPDRLKDQFCFRTKAAIDQIQFLESEKVWL